MHLISLEGTTGAKADNIVKKMICCDYSPTVIDLCKENQKRDLQFREANQKGIEVEYITADARKLPYPDCSFDLVLEKGTLDAMLSDKEDGESNCVLIMTECARVLKERGKYYESIFERTLGFGISFLTVTVDSFLSVNSKVVYY
jgi:ubiquinone/menaquinone biosynthesis C-methylase UbiE